MAREYLSPCYQPAKIRWRPIIGIASNSFLWALIENYSTGMKNFCHPMFRKKKGLLAGWAFNGLDLRKQSHPDELCSNEKRKHPLLLLTFSTRYSGYVMGNLSAWKGVFTRHFDKAHLMRYQAALFGNLAEKARTITEKGCDRPWKFNIFDYLTSYAVTLFPKNSGTNRRFCEGTNSIIHFTLAACIQNHKVVFQSLMMQ